jgi:hypothetical protein
MVNKGHWLLLLVAVLPLNCKSYKGGLGVSFCDTGTINAAN